jgi:hypothetical protein
MKIENEAWYYIECSCGQYRIKSGYDIPGTMRPAADQFGSEHEGHRLDVEMVKEPT